MLVFFLVLKQGSIFFNFPGEKGRQKVMRGNGHRYFFFNGIYNLGYFRR